jgi:membrane protein
VHPLSARGRIGAWPATAIPLRCLRRFAAIGGRDRALSLAGQAFIAFVPLVILISAIGSSDGTSAVAERIVRSYHLTGDGASAVRSLFLRPTSSHGTLTGIGLLVLISSLLSFSRAMQRTYEAAWGLAPKGVRGTLTGFIGIGLLLSEVLLLSMLAGALHPRGGGSVLLYLLRALAGVPFWLLLQYVLLSARVPARMLLPGAVVAAVGQTLVSIGSKVWIPHVVDHNADRYGVIGVTFALVSWLILLGIAMVAGAAVSVETSGNAAPPLGPNGQGPSPAGHDVGESEESGASEMNPSR